MMAEANIGGQGEHWFMKANEPRLSQDPRAYNRIESDPAECCATEGYAGGGYQLNPARLDVPDRHTLGRMANAPKSDQGEILQALDRLQERAQLLADTVNMLIRRLEPVLVPERPRPEKDPRNTPVIESVIGNRIEATTELIGQISARASEAAARVAL